MSSLNGLKQLLNTLGCKYLENEPMRCYTSFKIGGEARLMVFPKNAEELSLVYKFAKNEGVHTFILGRGSNLLVSDEGINGLVISTSGLNVLELSGNIIKCGSGVSLSKLCNFALENELGGLEFAYGIPGTAGGAAFMNAGAYGGEMKDVLFACSHVDVDGTLGALNKDDLNLSYRSSAYSNNDCVVTEILVELKSGSKEKIQTRMQELMGRRQDKQPLNFPSAGSVFKRPEGCFAGALIEECKLKGRQIGGAMVSEKHAGFIVNAGGATAADVRQLIELVQKTVFEQKGIMLETEIKFI